MYIEKSQNKLHNKQRLNSILSHTFCIKSNVALGVIEDNKVVELIVNVVGIENNFSNAYV